jgi:hypothetical protein
MTEEPNVAESDQLAARLRDVLVANHLELIAQDQPCSATRPSSSAMKLRALDCYPALGLALSPVRVAKVSSDQFAAHPDDGGLVSSPVEPANHREASLQQSALVAGVGSDVLAVDGISHDTSSSMSATVPLLTPDNVILIASAELQLRVGGER